MPNSKAEKIGKKACTIKKILTNGQVIRLLIALVMLLCVMGIIFIDNTITRNLRAGLKKALTYDMSMGGMISEIGDIVGDKKDIETPNDGKPVGGSVDVIDPLVMPAKNHLRAIYNLDTNELKIQCSNILSVLAMAQGKVKQVIKAEDGTYSIEIEHPANMTSIYKNLGMVYVKQGDTVKGKQLIAAANTADSAFYVALFDNGEPQNPIDYME